MRKFKVGEVVFVNSIPPHMRCRDVNPSHVCERQRCIKGTIQSTRIEEWSNRVIVLYNLDVSAPLDTRFFIEEKMVFGSLDKLNAERISSGLFPLTESVDYVPYFNK